MWLMFPEGAVSIVELPEKMWKDGVELQVRSRHESHLTNFREQYCPDLGETLNTPTMDYQYRAYCTRAQLAAAFTKVALDINYSNFKSATRDNRLHNVYMRVWSEFNTEYFDDGRQGRRKALTKGRGKRRKGGQSYLMQDFPGIKTEYSSLDEWLGRPEGTYTPALAPAPQRSLDDKLAAEEPDPAMEEILKEVDFSMMGDGDDVAGAEARWEQINDLAGGDSKVEYVRDENGRFASKEVK